MPIRYTGDAAPSWVHQANALPMTFPGSDRLRAAIMDESPLAFWLMGDASGYPQDASGNSRHMTSGTGTAAASPLVSLASGSYDLNGSSDYFSIADAAWMDTTAVTVEAVVRADALTNYRGVMNRDTGGGGGRAFQFRCYSGQIQIVLFVSGSPTTLTGSSTLSTGTTYHLAWAHDGSVSRLYVNGSLDGTSGTLGSLDSVTSAIRVGDCLSGTWDGRISHVAYHGSALSGATILAHAQAAGVA